MQYSESGLMAHSRFLAIVHASDPFCIAMLAACSQAPIRSETGSTLGGGFPSDVWSAVLAYGFLP